MTLDERVGRLEHDMNVLMTEVRRALMAVQEGISRTSATTSRAIPPSARWARKAWMLALLNVLLATALFMNGRFFAAGAAGPTPNPVLNNWLRSFWIAVAFMWLMLQMYPVALLLEQEEAPLKGVALRNVAALFTARPGLTLLLSLAVVALAVVASLLPELCFVVVLVALAMGGYTAVRRLRTGLAAKNSSSGPWVHRRR